jgi:hypothetical protein
MLDRINVVDSTVLPTSVLAPKIKCVGCFLDIGIDGNDDELLVGVVVVLVVLVDKDNLLELQLLLPTLTILLSLMALRSIALRIMIFDQGC